MKQNFNDDTAEIVRPTLTQLEIIELCKKGQLFKKDFNKQAPSDAGNNSNIG